jgi:4-hydroxy-tetrahydrodipicolinate synthase
LGGVNDGEVNDEEGIVRTTRRMFLETLGAAAALEVAAGAAAGESGPGLGADTAPSAGNKCLFWVAAGTPCDKNLKFDEAVYRDTLAYFKACGADGVVVLGTTGEYPSFSLAERKKIAEVAFKHRNGLNLIVSPGTCNFPETIELSQHAAANGADGLLIIPPFYFKHPPLEGLEKYYSLIFEQVTIPINLYHIPDLSAVPISHQLLRYLAKYPNLAGIKDSTGDSKGYQQFVEQFPTLNMRTGTDNNLKIALDHGMGAILQEGNAFTKEIAAVFAAKRAGKSIDEPLARMNMSLKLLRAAGVDEYGPMMYALSLQSGTPETYQRPPQLDVTDKQKTQVKQALQQIKQLG